MQLGATDLKTLSNISDKFVGLGKETLGVLIGNDRLQRQGDAQQTKASENLKALRDHARADAHQAKAKVIGSLQGEDEGHGVVTEIKGKAKQAAAGVLGDTEMRQDGAADEERGRAGRQATKAQTQAKTHEAKARAAGLAEDLASDRS